MITTLFRAASLRLRGIAAAPTVCRLFASGSRSNANLLASAAFDANPEATALILDHGQMSYGDLNIATGRVAHVLSKEYGIRKGDRILGRTSKSIDALSLYLATLKLGAIYVPLNNGYTAEETAHFVRDAEPRLFVTSTPAVDVARFRGQVKNVIGEDEIPRRAQNLSPMPGFEEMSKDDVACICYTSGTTGLPKGAMLTHSGLVASARALVKSWAFTPEDRLLHLLPFYHVHGMFISLNCALFSHSAIIWRPKFEVQDTLRWLRESTVMMGVPTFYARLVDTPSFSRDSIPSSLRLFVSGSAPLSPSVWERFRDLTGHTLLERYGMTEAQVICTNPYEGERRCGSVGPPIEGTQVRLNEEKVIEMKSDSVFGGYWRNEEKTKEEFTTDGWFITGDVGKVDEEGYISILGRGKDMIISGGLNVYPKEVGRMRNAENERDVICLNVEDVLDQLEGVAESAVIGEYCYVCDVDFSDLCPLAMCEWES